MKTATCFALLAAVACVSAQAQDAGGNDVKALWVDRHNYFRMTALPFAAGNMLRIKWSDELATQAQTDASGCAAAGAGAGVNAALVASATGAVDAAFQQWVVAPAMQAFPTLKAPKAAGEPVGAGVYNSYSQIVWASTNQVGCAQASCAGGKIGVACRYAPAGNDGTSPWYIHGPAGTACPEGMVSKVGLCVTAVDDPSYNDLAPIPSGANAYDVFKDFIPNMQKALKGEAVVVPAVTAAPDAATPAAGDKTTTAPAAGDKATMAPAAGDKTTTAPAAGDKTTTAPSATTTPDAGSSKADATTAPTAPTRAPSASTTEAPASGGDDNADAPVPTVTKVVDGKVYVKILPTSAPPSSSTTDSTATDSTGATPSPTVTKVVDGQVYVKVITSAPSTGSAADGTSTDPSVGETPVPTVTKVVNGVVYVKVDKDTSGEVVGTVKPGSGTGSSFSNQAATAASTPASSEPATSAIGANNKSSGTDQVGGFSAAGVAGVIVIGCVLVAGVAVFVSYRKNQQRQRDIMQNGGIHVL